MSDEKSDGGGKKLPRIGGQVPEPPLYARVGIWVAVLFLIGYVVVSCIPPDEESELMNFCDDAAEEYRECDDFESTDVRVECKNRASSMLSNLDCGGNYSINRTWLEDDD